MTTQAFFNVMDAMSCRDALIKERAGYRDLSKQCPNKEWASEWGRKADSEDLANRIRTAEDHAKAMFESWLDHKYSSPE